MLVLIISVLAATLNSMLLHLLPKGRSAFAVSLVASGVWVALLVSLSGGRLHISHSTLFWGVLYGVVQLLFMVSKARALSLGAVSLTTLIGNCSLVISTVASVAIWGERISAVQIVGIAVLLISLVLCTRPSEGQKPSAAWLLNCIPFCVFSALVGIVFKFFSKSSASEHTPDMMIIAAATMLGFLSLGQLIRAVWSKTLASEIKKLTAKSSENRRFWLVALGSGAVSCLYNRLNITLAGQLPGAVFFPGFNGGVILLSLLSGVLVFKERLTLRQGIGAALGLAAVIIIGIFK